jgi:hypothetical protein
MISLLHSDDGTIDDARMTKEAAGFAAGSLPIARHFSGLVMGS